MESSFAIVFTHIILSPSWLCYGCLISLYIFHLIDLLVQYFIMFTLLFNYFSLFHTEICRLEDRVEQNREAYTERDGFHLSC